MALLTRIYLNAVFGALGGLIGWMLLSIFDSTNIWIINGLLTAIFHPDPQNLESLQRLGDWVKRLSSIPGGGILGGAIGYFVVSVEAIRDRSLLRFFRLASYGLILGA